MINEETLSWVLVDVSFTIHMENDLIDRILFK